MSFNRIEWVGFFAFAVFCFADLIGERIGSYYGRNKKWYKELFGTSWWFHYFHLIIFCIIIWIALTLQFIAGFLFWKNSSSSSDNYTAALALYFSSSLALRFWYKTPCVGWKAWVALVFILGSLGTAIGAFVLFIEEHQTAPAVLYGIYGFWIVVCCALNIYALWIGHHTRYLHFIKKQKKDANGTAKKTRRHRYLEESTHEFEENGTRSSRSSREVEDEVQEVNVNYGSKDVRIVLGS